MGFLVAIGVIAWVYLVFFALAAFPSNEMKNKNGVIGACFPVISCEMRKAHAWSILRPFLQYVPGTVEPGSEIVVSTVEHKPTAQPRVRFYPQR